jgi:hypothetical protein
VSRRGRRGREDGLATAELALALPAVILVLALCLSGLSLAVDQVRCEDAARVAARAASRGETGAVVRELATARAPDRSEVTLSVQAGTVVVVVEAPRRTRHLPGLPAASATAVAILEPGVSR